jgi:hypothetical protein
MAQGKKKWIGFYNHILTDSEKNSVKALLTKNPSSQVGKWVSSLVEHGYKTTQSFEEEGGVATAAITGNFRSANEGWTLVVQHVDLYTAIAAVWFVADQVFDWGKWPTESGERPEVTW